MNKFADAVVFISMLLALYYTFPKWTKNKLMSSSEIVKWIMCIVVAVIGTEIVSILISGMGK